MKIVKDKKIIVLIITLVVFTIGYFIIVNKVSYSFSDNYDLENSYNNTIEIIEKCAIVYGKQNLELFDNEKIVYIKVQDLIDANLLAPNEDGKIINPLKKSENLNSNVIKLKYDNEKIIVEVDS